MTEIKEIDIKDLQVVEEAFTLEKDFIERVKILGVKEIEPLLEEGVKVIGRLEKYEFLALLRDLFIEFRKLGDTKILISEGTCGICGAYKVKSQYSSIRPVRKVVEMKGNHSGEAFYFALLSEDHEPLKFRICNGFVDRNGNTGEGFGITSKLGEFARLRQDELSGYR